MVGSGGAVRDGRQRRGDRRRAGGGHGVGVWPAAASAARTAPASAGRSASGSGRAGSSAAGSARARAGPWATATACAVGRCVGAGVGSASARAARPSARATWSAAASARASAPASATASARARARARARASGKGLGRGRWRRRRRERRRGRRRGVGGSDGARRERPREAQQDHEPREIHRPGASVVRRHRHFPPTFEPDRKKTKEARPKLWSHAGLLETSGVAGPSGLRRQLTPPRRSSRRCWWRHRARAARRRLVALNHSASTSPTPSPTLCVNTDNGATDSASPRTPATRTNCMPPSVCGGYDDADFSANDMCCACGGGDGRLGDALLLARPMSSPTRTTGCGPGDA